LEGGYPKLRAARKAARSEPIEQVFRQLRTIAED
jgi:hypothetical protein